MTESKNSNDSAGYIVVSALSIAAYRHYRYVYSRAKNRMQNTVERLRKENAEFTQLNSRFEEQLGALDVV